jgi:hypothetical protein
MIADATIRIRLLTTEEGGRLGAIRGPRYGCPLMVKGQGFDCRFLLNDEQRLELGHTHELGVKFLNADSACAALEVGMAVSLWEGKTIGVGEVITVHAS